MGGGARPFIARLKLSRTIKELLLAWYTEKRSLCTGKALHWRPGGHGVEPRLDLAKTF